MEISDELFANIFRAFAKENPNLVRELIREEPTRSILENRYYDAPKDNGPIVQIHTVKEIFEQQKARIATQERLEKMPKCVHCLQPILGGKGDYWHATRTGLVGDMRCFDSDNIATPMPNEL